jgi:hypothetical protein
MSKTIVFPFGSKKNSEYSVSVVPAYSSTRKTIKTKGVSDCCKDKGGETGNRTYCKECDDVKPVGWKTPNKKFEFCGKEHIVPAEKLDGVLKTMENTDIVVKSILSVEPAVARDLYGGLKFVTPSKDNEQEYAELRDILGTSTAVVEYTERRIQYQGLLSVNRDGIIQLRLLQEGEALRNPELNLDEVKASAEVVGLKQKILANLTNDSYDLMGFRDQRNELEEEVLEGLISGKQVEAIAEEVVASSQSDELAELKALAGGE